MGLLNLIPILPLDGGHIVLAGLDRLVGDSSKKVMLWFSIGLTSAMGLYLMVSPGLEGLAVFVLFPLMIQIQMLTASRPQRPNRGPNAAAAAGEAAAWASGDVGSIPPALVPSPWFRAAQQARHGFPEVAHDVLVADFADTSPADWWPPDAAPLDDLRALVALLPRPLPTGRLYSEHVLSNILVRLGLHDEAARYAAESFGRHRSTTTAAVVARAASALGDTPTALGWLRAAIEADTASDLELRDTLLHRLRRYEARAGKDGPDGEDEDEGTSGTPQPDPAAASAAPAPGTGSDDDEPSGT